MTEPTVVIVTGGLSAAPMHATVGDVRIDRMPGETLAELRARAVDLAWSAGQPFAIIGGLPR